ncbi:MAG: outer membrane protein assembly factor BamA [Candidatus Omnitrophica bacterium]|nr:outer membrane protein assembly factor BamA [Candidatus Omnitrophota bacterium]
MKVNMRSGILIYILFIIILPSPLFAQSPESPDPSVEEKQELSSTIVKSIEIKGNKTISIAMILSKIKTRVGQEYLQSVISDDLKRLYNTGYFSDVRVDRESYEGGFKVIIYLDEKPIVEEITFSKMRYFKPRSLLKKIKTQEGKFLDHKSLKDDTDTIKELYSKKGLTLAEVEVETSIDEATNKAKLHFIVTEGNKVQVKRIYVDGNEAFKDKKILKAIKTRNKGFFRKGYLKDEVLDEDMERVKSFYGQNGYIDAVCEYTVEELGKGLVNIRIQVSEGKQYSVGKVTILGHDVLSEEEIRHVMEETKEGGVFSRQKLSVDIANIRTLYFDRGYIFANVDETTSLDQTTGKVEVKVNIEEGGLAFINRINIEGNTRTRDIVIRRELRLNPGDRFDGGKLRRSRERLENLGYFEDIGFDIEDTDVSDKKDLVVQVKETKTGSFSFGGGFSTVDKIVGFIEVEQRNFDFTNWPTFTGGGQNLKLRAETGETRNNLLLSFVEPWIFDHPVSLGLDAFRTERDKESDVGYAYDEESVGGGISLGKQFSDYVSGKVAYKYRNVTIENLDENVSSALAAEEGTNAVSVIGISATRDSTDSSFAPTRGLIVNSGADVAGTYLGGDKDFYRLQVRGNYYIPFKFDSVLELRARAGYVDAYGDSTSVPIFERFFAGGARTIRGYNERKVGPLDPNTGDPVGGEGLLTANIECTIPIIEFIKLAAFFDTGNVWAEVEDFGSGELKSGTGLGLRVKTPIGPVNLDYGYPLNDEPGEDERSGKFYFSVSRGF